MEDNGIVKFVGSMENGSVFCVTDIEGKDLVYVTIVLKDNGQTLAATPLHFIDFPNRNRQREFSIVK